MGVFLHSLAVYNLKADNLVEAIQVAGQSGFRLIQLGPVSDDYLGDTGAAKRDQLVGILRREKVNVGPLCVCYESGEGRGGQERYDNIEAIAKTGGYGYEGEGSKRIIAERIQLTNDHIDLAAHLKTQGVISSDRAVLTTHAGFFDRPGKRDGIREAVAGIVRYCKEKDVYFAIETGSERMKELIGFVQEVEKAAGIEGRLGINFDPANFLLYGTQDPLEALNILSGENSKYLFGVHAKDAIGTIEKDGRANGDWKGSEMPVGTGSVEWYKTMRTLHELGYNGPIIIEREGGLPAVKMVTNLRIEETKDAFATLRRAEAYALANIQIQKGVPFK